jgi:hypothetical protein
MVLPPLQPTHAPVIRREWRGDCSRSLIAACAPKIVPLPFLQLCSPSKPDPGERMKDSKNVQEPQHNTNDHDCVQNGLDRSLHGYEAVDQPKQNTHHDQN